MPRAKDKSKRVVGLVCPERYYTIEAAKRYAGIGRPQLIEARKAGVITPIPVGRFLWIRGEQIIAWIEWHAKDKRQSSPKDHDRRPPPELLTRQQTAALLGIEAQTLANWATTGRYGLKHVKVGRSVRYRREDIEKFLDAN